MPVWYEHRGFFYLFIVILKCETDLPATGRMGKGAAKGVNLEVLSKCGVCESEAVSGGSVEVSDRQ